MSDQAAELAHSVWRGSTSGIYQGLPNERLWLGPNASLTLGAKDGRLR